MKKIFLLFISIVLYLTSYADVRSVTSTPGQLGTLTKSYRTTVNNLTITGTMDARDFRDARDSMPNLTTLDISGVTIVAYTGIKGTRYSILTTYSSNEIPSLAFSPYDWFDVAWNKITNIRTLILPNNLTSIGNEAFEASKISSLIIPPTVTNIGESAFSSCKLLTDIIIPSSVNTIGFSAFSLSNLTSITIPSGVTTIPPSMIEGCLNITTVNLPSSITSIGKYSFRHLVSLTDFNCEATTPPLIDPIAFDLTQVKYVKLNVPASSYIAYSKTPTWSQFFSMNTPYPSSIGGFSTIRGTVSSTRSMSISKSANLLDLTITAPIGFEIKPYNIDVWSNSIVLSSPTESLPTQFFDVRIASNASAGSLTGNIVCSSTASPAQNVSVSGTVAPTPQTITFGTLTNKIYGDDSFTLSATTTSGLPIIYTSDNTAVATVSGSTVTIVGAGSTNITASQAGDTNYSAANNVTQVLTVSKLPITITINPVTKIYGSADPAFIARVTTGTIQGTDVASGTLTRVPGVNVGTYVIGKGSYTYGSNYAETFVPANMKIVKRAITITSDPKTKVYGDAEPAFTAQVTTGTIQGTDVATGSLSRSAGENVGTYSISQDTYTYGSNYAETFVPANLAITQRAITISADPKTKIYGDAEPAFTAQVTTGTIQGTDVATGSLSRAAGENVGAYSISQDTYTYGSNYNETFVPANLTITQRAITISADPVSKVYGDVEPTFTAQVTAGTIQGSDVVTGSLTRVGGENVGVYAIGQGAYTFGSNYAETFVPDNLTITKRGITITADPKTKVYGDAEPAFTAMVTTGTIQGLDVATGTLSRVAGENVGTYAVNHGTYTYGSNYAETFVPASLAITQRAITISADPKTKIYGDVEPAFTAQVTTGTIQGTDVATGSLTRVAGDNVGSYAVSHGTYTYGSNYAETFVPASLAITQRAITISADPKTKVYGDAEPAFTAQVTTGTIQGTDVATGSLSRAAGENVGAYSISQDTYTYGSNYNETFVPANLTITQRAITISADPKTKIYGDVEPAFTAQITAGTIQETDVATGSLTRVAGENVGAYAVNQGTYTYGENYDETFVDNSLTISQRPITITADAASKVYGDADPAFTAQVTTGTIQGTDVASGTLSRVAGENAGAYAINKGIYTYGENYNETFVDNSLTISQRPITITADPASKVYGDADPAFTAQVTTGTIQGTDVASGTLSRVAGENAGAYAINKGIYTYGENYNETFVDNSLTISQRPITITADPVSKVYGDVEPTFTAQVTAGTIQGTDVATGTLSRSAGENVGAYSISQDTYTYGSNYNETFVPANLTITQRAITISADPKTKVYGDAEPAFTAMVTTGTIQGLDVATGTLSRVAGENVGTYAVNHGTYTYGSNYAETFVPASLAITQRAITISADPKTKIYGDVEPAFTAQVTTGTIQGTDVATGSLSRAVGENVGAYSISQDTYTYGSNYAETFVPASLAITQRAITISADPKTKIYGDVEPAFTAQVTTGTIQGTDVATGSLSRAVGENVGAYSISQDTYTYGSNYNETFVPANLTITQRAITISADPKTKVYGDAEPAFTAQVTTGTIQGTDVATGSLSRAAGENVGAYSISQDTYIYGSNYAETFVPANLTITQRAITISADPKTKIYGDVEPAFTAQITAGTIQETDVATGSLTRVAGENVGAYAVNQGTYTYGENYDETFVDNSLTISQRPITITADAASKVYGDADPAFTAQVTTGTIQGTDVASGTLSRVAGENAGAYAINKGIYTYGENYNETFVDNSLTISQRPITITADPVSKVYGDVEPTFTAQVTAGTIQGTDVATGTLSRSAGENVGAYSISQDTYTYGSNYNETFVPANLTITQRAITISADPKTKVYGDAEPAFTAMVTTGTIQGLDVATGTLSRVAGENVGTYAVNHGTYTYGSNYAETFVPASLAITQRAITISADPKTKIYGDADPAFTAQVTTGTIQGTDVATGTLSRAVGENVGAYSISQDTYTYGSNYNETFVPANLTITQRAITISADPKTKVYGDAEPAFTAQVTTGTIQGTDVATGSLSRAAGENVGAYSISQDTYTYGSNYNETFVPANLTITQRAITISADPKTKIYGDVEPAFTAQVTTGTIQGTDVATGTLSRSAGENAGAYSISQDTYTYGSNYNETFVPANLTITQRAIIISADPKTKIYGDVEPAFTAQITAGTIQETDVATGSLTRVAGENVGAYAVNQGTYTYGENYDETFVDNSLTISQRPITITADAASKVYGDADPAFTAHVTVGTIQGTDVATGSLTRVSGENVGNYALNQGSFTYGGNYNETFVSENLTITPNITVGEIILSIESPTLSACENTQVEIPYTISKGSPTKYKITFDSAANSEGIQNIDYTVLPTNSNSGIILFQLPIKVKGGVYKGTLQMIDDNGIVSANYTFSFNVNLSSDYVFSKWEDVVTCDNSNNNFVDYQWYKNGLAINGATQQYYGDLNGLAGSYFVRVTTTDGQALLTCPKEFSTILKKSVKAYPSPIKTNQSLTIETVGFGDEDLKDATLTVCSPEGSCVYQSKTIERFNTLNLGVPQIYVGHIKTNNGHDYVFKIIVQK